MKVVFVGGDARTPTAAQALSALGYETELAYFGEWGAPSGGADVAVFPAPCELSGGLNAPFYDRKVTVAEAVSHFSPDTLFFGGYPILSGFSSKSYLSDEGFASQNAAVTAEAAVALALIKRKDCFSGASVLILGFGRIGARLAKILYSLGASVRVAIRNGSVRSAAGALGYGTVGFDSLEAPFSVADAVFSTVPEAVTDEKAASALKGDALFFELASLPGGCTEGAREVLGDRLINARSLPGRIAPVAAGRILGETVHRLLTDSEVNL